MDAEVEKGISHKDFIYRLENDLEFRKLAIERSNPPVSWSDFLGTTPQDRISDKQKLEQKG